MTVALVGAVVAAMTLANPSVAPAELGQGPQRTHPPGLVTEATITGTGMDPR